jgi:hypothetical protein
MSRMLFSELVHKAAVQGGFRLVFVRKSENREEEYDKDTQEEQCWTFRNTISVTKLIEYLTMTKYIRSMILIHDPTTSLFNEYKYRQIGVTGDSESKDEDTRLCKKYGKQEA